MVVIMQDGTHQETIGGDFMMVIMPDHIIIIMAILAARLPNIKTGDVDITVIQVIRHPHPVAQENRAKVSMPAV